MGRVAVGTVVQADKFWVKAGNGLQVLHRTKLWLLAVWFGCVVVAVCVSCDDPS